MLHYPVYEDLISPILQPFPLLFYRFLFTLIFDLVPVFDSSALDFIDLDLLNQNQRF